MFSSKPQVVYEGEGYVGLGFSSNGDMVPADAVIGLPDEGTALEYDLSTYVGTAGWGGGCPIPPKS